MKAEQDKLPFTERALAALESEVNTGKYLFSSSELSRLGIDAKMLEVEDGVAGITIPTYLKKIYYSELCDADLGQIKMLPLERDEKAKIEGIKKFIVFKCPDHIFNLIHEVRNISAQIHTKRGTAWAYQHDTEMYRHDEKRAVEMSKKLTVEADELQKTHGGKMIALQSLCAASSAIRLEVMELIMKETSIRE